MGCGQDIGGGTEVERMLALLCTGNNLYVKIDDLDIRASNLQKP